MAMATALRGCGDGHRKAVSRWILCSPSFLSTYLPGDSVLRDANQVRPQRVDFYSTKTGPLLQDVRDRCRSGSVGLEEGLCLFNSLILKKRRPPISDFDQLIQAISSNSSSASSVVITLSKVMSVFGIQLSIVNFNMLMDCCFRMGQLDLRFCLGRILRLGLAPNDVTWSTLFIGLIAEGCRKHPIVLLLPTVIAALNDSDGGLQRCLEHVIDQKSTKVANQLILPLMLSGTPFFYRTCLLRGLLMSIPSKEESSILFDKMIADQSFPDAPAAYSALIDALSHQGMMAEAEKLLHHMTTKKNRLTEANELLDQMIQRGHKPTRAFLQQTNSDIAQMCFHSLELAADAEPPASDTICNASPMIGANQLVADSNIYCFLLDGMCKARKLRQATQLFNSVSAIGLRPEARMYDSMLAALCREGRFDKIPRLFREMIEERIDLDVPIFSKLVKGCQIHLKKVSRPLNFFNDEIQKGFVPGEQSKPLLEAYLLKKKAYASEFHSICNNSML